MAFVVAAIWRARPGEEERVAATIRTMTPLSRAEEGNLYYQAQVSFEDPRKFLLYEQYVDAAAYEAHKRTPHFRRQVVEYVLDLLEERTVQTYLTIDV